VFDPAVSEAPVQTVTGAGNDILIGGQWAGPLYGGEGHDTFVFRSLAEKGDVVKDFTPGEDILDLHQVMESIGYTGHDPVADKVVSFVAEGSGTAVMVAPHGAAGPAAPEQLVLLENVVPTALKADPDYFAWH
jgi:Ca2+-binding RTX toxin-like protein